VTHYKSMWAYGKHFRIEKMDKLRCTFDCGISAYFDVVDSGNIETKTKYYGILEDIMELDFRAFRKVIFLVKWFSLIEKGNNRTIYMHDNGFPMIKTSDFMDTDEPYVFPEQCEQIFIIQDMQNPNWSSVIEHNPRWNRHASFINTTNVDIIDEDETYSNDEVEIMDEIGEHVQEQELEHIEYTYEEEEGQEDSEGQENGETESINDEYDSTIFDNLVDDDIVDEREDSGINLFIDLGEFDVSSEQYRELAQDEFDVYDED
ncbi:hypothetical protein KI387_004990, partial [Taxus chinensis]